MGGRSGYSGVSGAGVTSTAAALAPAATLAPAPATNVSDYSTGGKLRRESQDQWFGANDNGAYVVINAGGSSDYNLYRYGSRTIYEVDRYYGNANSGGRVSPDRFYASTQAQAVQMAKDWLAQTKDL